MMKKLKSVLKIMIGTLITIAFAIYMKSVIEHWWQEGLRMEIIPICMLYFPIFVIIFMYFREILLSVSEPIEVKKGKLEDVMVVKFVKNHKHYRKYREKDIGLCIFPKRRTCYQISGRYWDPKDEEYHNFIQNIYDLIDIELDKYIKQNNITVVPLIFTITKFVSEVRIDVKKLKEDSLKYATSYLSDTQILKKVFRNYSGIMMEWFVIMLAAMIFIILKTQTISLRAFIIWVTLLALFEIPHIVLIFFQYKRIKKIHEKEV